MCLGTVGLITTVGPDQRAGVRVGDRDLTASLLAFGDAVGPGDWVLVHSGLVLARLTELEAREALELRHPTTEGTR